jgi:hypothetical protein
VSSALQPPITCYAIALSYTGRAEKQPFYLPKSDKWKAKYEEPEPPDTEGLPELPEGWVWTTVDALSLSVDYGTSQKADYGYSGVPVLRMSIGRSIPTIVIRGETGPAFAG